ncbi:MAG: hypothetical protein NC095_02960 [Muribaculum sp.]|nr:hypothetical protein [Muribaculum sp.]
MSRIKNPDILRAKVQKIESEIREIIDSNGRWNDIPQLHDKVECLLADRASYLDRMFRATPSEVARIEALNEMLLKKVETMKTRAAMLWQTMLTMKQMPEFDDDYDVRAELRVSGDRSDEEAILHLPEDDYYGSDFALANEAIVAVIPTMWSHAHCGFTVHPWKVNSIGDNPDKTFTSSMEDGQSWAEGALCHPALSHICICYPIHDLVTHLQFSIPDLLRINTFTTKVSLEISNDTTQSGIRSFEKEYRSWRTDAATDFGYKKWLKS